MRNNDTETLSAVLDALEALARQCCYTGDDGMGGNITDSGAMSSYAGALRALAKHGRFRVDREAGRMVIGYWPEHDPAQREGGQ